MQKWEYFVAQEIDNDGMNELGNEGWELVCMVPASSGQSGNVVIAVFKRHKE